MKRRIYISLIAGISAPLLAPFLLGLFVGRPYYVQGILRLHFESPGAILFGLGLPLIPFAALVVLVWWLSSFNIAAPRLDYIFWGGLIAVWGFTIYAHWTLWYPLYAGRRVSSTAAIALLFIPFYALAFLAMGAIVGWVASFLPKLKS